MRHFQKEVLQFATKTWLAVHDALQRSNSFVSLHCGVGSGKRGGPLHRSASFTAALMQ